MSPYVNFSQNSGILPPVPYGPLDPARMTLEPHFLNFYDQPFQKCYFQVHSLFSQLMRSISLTISYQVDMNMLITSSYKGKTLLSFTPIPPTHPQKKKRLTGKATSSDKRKKKKIHKRQQKLSRLKRQEKG